MNDKDKLLMAFANELGVIPQKDDEFTTKDICALFPPGEAPRRNRVGEKLLELHRKGLLNRRRIGGCFAYSPAEGVKTEDIINAIKRK